MMAAVGAAGKQPFNSPISGTCIAFAGRDLQRLYWRAWSCSQAITSASSCGTGPSHRHR